MINVESKQKIKDDVQNCFIERNKNTIYEKISELIKAGFTKDDAHHTVIQVVQNLPKYLLPLNSAATKGQDAEDAEDDEDIENFARMIVS